MPTGPRLWLRPERRDTGGRVTHAATWLILDGSRQLGTGCHADDRRAAEQALGTSEIPIADVLTLYLRDVAPRHSRPGEAVKRLRRLGTFFASHTLADINGPLCREYAEAQNTDTMARRDLEELRAAINHHRREGLHDRLISVVAPPRRPSRERWLTRSEAARLIWAAWRFREVKDGRPTSKRPRRHIAHFILVALYTGSRASGGQPSGVAAGTWAPLRRSRSRDALPPPGGRQGIEQTPPHHSAAGGADRAPAALEARRTPLSWNGTATRSGGSAQPFAISSRPPSLGPT